jgi:hypothetical protein
VSEESGKRMTRQEFEARIREICPGAQFEVDNEGQTIIYTDMYEVSHGDLSEVQKKHIEKEVNEILKGLATGK